MRVRKLGMLIPLLFVPILFSPSGYVGEVSGITPNKLQSYDGPWRPFPSSETFITPDPAPIVIFDTSMKETPPYERRIGGTLFPQSTPATSRSTRTTSRSVRGTASWYCLAGRSACPSIHSHGMYAAAGPALRVGNWRGRTVIVCSGRCIKVKLVDWCACPDRAIDLFGDAFRRLAPLSRGVMTVTVKW